MAGVNPSAAEKNGFPLDLGMDKNGQKLKPEDVPMDTNTEWLSRRFIQIANDDDSKHVYWTAQNSVQREDRGILTIYLDRESALKSVIKEIAPWVDPKRSTTPTKIRVREVEKALSENKATDEQEKIANKCHYKEDCLWFTDPELPLYPDGGRDFNTAVAAPPMPTRSIGDIFYIDPRDTGLYARYGNPLKLTYEDVFPPTHKRYVDGAKMVVCIDSRTEEVIKHMMAYFNEHGTFAGWPPFGYRFIVNWLSDHELCDSKYIVHLLKRQEEDDIDTLWKHLIDEVLYYHSYENILKLEEEMKNALPVFHKAWMKMRNHAIKRCSWNFSFYTEDKCEFVCYTDDRMDLHTECTHACNSPEHPKYGYVNHRTFQAKSPTVEERRDQRRATLHRAEKKRKLDIAENVSKVWKDVVKPSGAIDLAAIKHSLNQLGVPVLSGDEPGIPEAAACAADSDDDQPVMI